MVSTRGRAPARIGRKRATMKSLALMVGTFVAVLCVVLTVLPRGASVHCVSPHCDALLASQGKSDEASENVSSVALYYGIEIEGYVQALSPAAYLSETSVYVFRPWSPKAIASSQRTEAGQTSAGKTVDGLGDISWVGRSPATGRAAASEGPSAGPCWHYCSPLVRARSRPKTADPERHLCQQTRCDVLSGAEPCQGVPQAPPECCCGSIPGSRQLTF